MLIYSELLSIWVHIEAISPENAKTLWQFYQHSYIFKFVKIWHQKWPAKLFKLIHWKT